MAGRARRGAPPERRRCPITCARFARACPAAATSRLSDADVLRIHHAALDVLENIGLADATPSGIEYMTKAGAKLDARRAG